MVNRNNEYNNGDKYKRKYNMNK